MRNRIFVLTASFVLILGAVATYAQMGTGRVTGSVSDTQGNPIEGATIIATDSGGKTLEATTGSEGKWAILGFRTGTYEFTVSAPGFQPQAYKQQVRQVGRNPAMDFVLEAQQAAQGGPSLLGEANELFEQKQYNEALLKYEEVLVENPTLYQIHYNMGNVYREMGDEEKALEEFNKVLAEDPLHTASLINVGDIKVGQQKLEEAVSYFEKAIDQTEDEIVPFNVAEIYFNQGNAAKAIEFYQIASERKPDWADPHLKMGYAYLNTGDMEAAAGAFEKVVEVAPDSPQAQMAQAALSSLK